MLQLTSCTAVPIPQTGCAHCAVLLLLREALSGLLQIPLVSSLQACSSQRVESPNFDRGQGASRF
jgi:hypothetical protein